MESREAPPAPVTAAFALSDTAVHPLSGGRGRAWSAGDLILKPVDGVREATWAADVRADLVEDGFRINRPVRSETGSWVVDGWSAWAGLVGEHDTSGRWDEVLRVGERLNAALRGVARPDVLDSRSHAWAVGDRVAWDEEPAVLIHEAVQPLAEPPFCQAIVAVDAVLWHGASPQLFSVVPGENDRTSLLARAAMYRLVASDRFAAGQEPRSRRKYLRSVVADHERVLGHLVAQRVAGST